MRTWGFPFPHALMPSRPHALTTYVLRLTTYDSPMITDSVVSRPDKNQPPPGATVNRSCAGAGGISMFLRNGSSDPGHRTTSSC